MDIEMPVMNGIEAAKRIREYEKSGALLSHIPIIAITANARLEQITVAKDAGMDDVVSKPFRIPELLAKIEVFLGPLKRRK
jgi:CheY-like chemotaxis protein